MELCASADSELTKHVPYGFVAPRITDKEDFTKISILKAIEEIIRVAKKHDVHVVVCGLLFHVLLDVIGNMSTLAKELQMVTMCFPANR